MHWIQSWDTALFRFINDTLANPVFDQLMPFASGNKFFMPAGVVAAVLLAWKGGRRGRLCLLMLALIVGPGDGLVINTLKHAFARPRPFVGQQHVRFLGVKTTPATTAGFNGIADPEHPIAAPRNHNSMPSAHAANCFAATMILLVYYRRSWRFLLPLAGTVAFSRVYNGVHYPSDVLVGAILGAGYAAAGMWALNSLWRWAGRNWFPLWWEKLPSLVNPEFNSQQPTINTESLHAVIHARECDRASQR